MNFDDITGITTAALKLCLIVSLPAVIAAAGSGLLIAFVQAITSLQDASISHSVKLIVVVIVIALTANWGASAILDFAQATARAAFP